MLIECLIRRANGSTVELDANVYHFKPTESDPRHLSTVENEDHQAKILRVKEAFAEAQPIGDAQAARVAKALEEKAIAEKEAQEAALKAAEAKKSADLAAAQAEAAANEGAAAATPAEQKPFGAEFVASLDDDDENDNDEANQEEPAKLKDALEPVAEPAPEVKEVVTAAAPAAKIDYATLTRDELIAAATEKGFKDPHTIGTKRLIERLSK